MKAIFTNTDAKTCYIVDANEELSKVLDACNYHTKLSPAPQIYLGGDKCIKYVIDEKDNDKLHVVRIRKEQDYTGFCFPNFVYDVLPADKMGMDDEKLASLDKPTPDDVGNMIRDFFEYTSVREENVSIDCANDFLEWYYDGRVVDREEYVNFDNLSEEEKNLLAFDLNQVDFFEKGSPEAHVLHEIEERIPSRFEELAAQSNSEDLVKFVENFPQARDLLNQKSDDEKLDIVKRNRKIIGEIDYPSLDMLTAADKAAKDFQHRNLIGVKTMIEELEEKYAWCIEGDHDFGQACNQIEYFYATQKGLPQDLAEDVALNPEESIERLHDGSYVEYWAEMARTGHYEEQDKEEKINPTEKPKYLVMSKVSGECGIFKTLEEAVKRIGECEELDKYYEIYEKGRYQIVDPFSKEVAEMKHRNNDFER